MKNLILFILFISCTSANDIKYIPKETMQKDTITNLINKARIENDLNLLQSETLLISLSKIKAMQMESDKEVNHNGFASLQVGTESFGEIVGYGYKTESILFQNYMNSEEHNKIILGDFTHIGSYTSNSYNCILFAKY